MLDFRVKSKTDADALLRYLNNSTHDIRSKRVGNMHLVYVNNPDNDLEARWYILCNAFMAGRKSK